MRLSKLEMQGFKSFAKKTELIVSNGVTAVIGPNGSGKSNLSDAIRWALGEQSARALRGNKMEDVIFNGTAVKHPLSMCAVSLTFENEDRYLNCESNEVVITRRAFRSGDSEYSINGKDCRLKDILDLFRDTGIGKDGYSVISQGGVDSILSNRTQDRREALEEAVGVTRFRVRREESVRKLAQAQKNIERLQDILNELNGRLIPLKRESIKAKEAQSLQNDLKIYEINHFLIESEKFEEKIHSLEILLAQYGDALCENKNEDALLQSRIEALEKETAILENQLSQLREEHISLLSQQDSIRSSIRIETDRKQTAETESERLQNELAETLQNIEHCKNSVSSHTNDDNGLLPNLKETLIAKDTAYLQSCQCVEEAENQLEALKNAVMETLNRLSERRSDRSRLEAMREALSQRSEAIGKDFEAITLKENCVLKEREDAQKSCTDHEEKLSQCTEEIEKADADRRKAELEKSSIAVKLQDNERELISKQSNLKVIGELVRKREGYQNSVRLVMNDVQKNKHLSSSIIGVVAEMISVPKQYETAIGTALGGSLQYIIAATGDDAKTIIDWARTNQYGRVTVLPIDILRNGEKDTRLISFLSKPGVIGVADKLISCSDRATKAIEFLLGRTLVVEDMNCALRLRREDRCYMQIVTLEGDMLQSSGILSGGSKVKRSFDILTREREWTEIQEEIRILSEKKQELVQLLDEAEEKRKNAGASLYLKQNEYKTLQIDFARIKEKADIIERDVCEIRAQHIKLKEEEEHISDSLKDISEKIRQLDMEESAISAADSTSKESIIQKQKQVIALRNERDMLLKEFTDAKIKLASAEKDALTRSAEKQKLTAEIAAYERKEEQQRERIATCMGIISAKTTECESLHLQETSICDALKAVQEKIGITQEKLLQCKEESGEFRKQRDALLNESRLIFEKQSKSEMAMGKIKTQQEQLADSVWQNYEITYENALSYKLDTLPTGLSEKINGIKKRLKEIGTVNPGSIPEYEEVSERHETLSNQLKDVITASKDLENLIAKLTKTMEKTFKEGFAKIQEQFELVFTELFGGGKAELRLKDPSDVLNTEIEIIAQPPGKKFQLLSLMSGGERALTAIAFLFAMLRIKSPSFCVLDEIESSLDEENVNRYASFLKKYGKQTQFIVITHRKGSMEAADSIYGVSMEEKGISTIISAKWEEKI